MKPWALALLLLPACSPWGSDFVVYADPAFTPEQTETLTQATEAWQAAVPVRLHVISGYCHEVSDAKICVHPLVLSRGEFGVTEVQPNTDGGDVFIDVTQVASYPDSWLLLHDFEHELGHAMGLVHSSKGTLMYADAYGGSSQGKITKDDVVQWNLLRGIAP